jgi:Tfp pilus assembly PilM family ATPase
LVIGHLSISKRMPRLLALEWDQKEARVVIARTRPGGVAVEHALAVKLPEREGGAATEAEIGAALSRALGEYGVSRAETLVAVGRASIELKFLSTPPAPPEELPDLVRFQAMRQFTSLAEDWPLDFVPLSPNADGGSNVLAAAIAPELVTQIRQTCDAAHLRLSRLVLRPFAAASLIKAEAADDKCRMVVDLLGDDADLTVLIGQQVIFPRTVRLPAAAEPEVLARALLGEGRRTIIAAQNQLGGRRVEEVVIFDDGLHHSTVKQVLERELSLPVKLVDPFDKVQWAEGTRSRKPEFPGTFAPLLGMLLDEDAGPVAGVSAHAIDFLHPRKRPPPPNRRRTMIIAAAAVAAVVLLGLGAIQWQLRSLDAEIRTLGRERADQEKLAKSSAKPREEAEKLDRFSRGDVIWLDALERMSSKAPPPNQLMLEDMTANYVPSGGGKVNFNAHTDNEARIRQIEEMVRSANHKVASSDIVIDPEAGALKVRFSQEITVVPPEEDDAPAPAPGAASKTKGPIRPKAAKGGGS